MFPIPRHSTTECPSCQEVIVQQSTYEEQLAEHLAVKHVAEAKERGIPLWMLRGFPALSDEPDQDDPIDFQ